MLGWVHLFDAIASMQKVGLNRVLCVEKSSIMAFAQRYLRLGFFPSLPGSIKAVTNLSPSPCAVGTLER